MGAGGLLLEAGQQSLGIALAEEMGVRRCLLLVGVTVRVVLVSVLVSVLISIFQSLPEEAWLKSCPFPFPAPFPPPPAPPHPLYPPPSVQAFLALPSLNVPALETLAAQPSLAQVLAHFLHMALAVQVLMALPGILVPARLQL